MADNPPAFPRSMGSNGLTHHHEHDANDAQVGMELRDYFAGQALTGLLMQQSNMAAMKSILEGVGIEVHETVSGLSYAYADAMLAAREKAAV